MIPLKARYWQRKTVPKFQVEYNSHGFLTASAGLILPAAFGNKNFSPSNFAMPSFDGSGCLPIATQYGPSLSANGGWCYKFGSVLLGTGPMTVATIFRTTNTNTASNNNFITVFGANQAYEIWGISVENGVVWGRFFDATISAGSGLNDGLHHTLVMVKPDSANVQSVSIYVDGVALATSPNTSTNTLNIGAGTLAGTTTNIFYDEPGSTGQFSGDVPLLAYDNSAWTAEQAAYFNDEPFSMLKPVHRRVYSVPASGTAINVSDTLSLSDSITSIVASVSVSDALVIADAISALAASVPISDVLALADSVSVSTGTNINVSDTLSLSDILSAIDATLSPADTMALSETVNIIVTSKVTDSLTMLDSASVKNAFTASDGLSLADAVSVVKGTAKSISISDTLTLSDEILGTLFARSMTLVPSLKSRLSLQTSMNGILLLTPSLKGTVQLH